MAKLTIVALRARRGAFVPFWHSVYGNIADTRQLLPPCKRSVQCRRFISLAETAFMARQTLLSSVPASRRGVGGPSEFSSLAEYFQGEQMLTSSLCARFFTEFLPAQSECRPENVWCARPGKTFEAIVPLRASHDERKVAVDWLKTGAPGLEHVFDDDIPEFSFGLGLGLPGCAEVMLAHQIIVALASPQRPAPGLAVPGEPSESRLRYQQQFNFGRGNTLKSVVRCVRAHGRARR